MTVPERSKPGIGFCREFGSGQRSSPDVRDVAATWIRYWCSFGDGVGSEESLRGMVVGIVDQS
jgi:hypothetical protein